MTRLEPVDNEGEQLRDREAEFVRALLAHAESQGVDITNLDAIATELEPYYPDMLLGLDEPQGVIYKYIWDEILGWVRICQEADTLVLDGPLIINPIVVVLRNGMILS